jgi:hypothetical protein
MASVSGTPRWDALVTELGDAPSDPVVAKLPTSTLSLWASWIAMTATMFVPVVAAVPRWLFPGWAILVCLVDTLLMVGIHRRQVRAECAPLACFGLELKEDPTPGILGWLFWVDLALRGRRLGRSVLVRVEVFPQRAGSIVTSVVSVGAPSPRFEVSGNTLLFAEAGATAPVLALLDAIAEGLTWSADYALRDVNATDVKSREEGPATLSRSIRVSPVPQPGWELTFKTRLP